MDITAYLKRNGVKFNKEKTSRKHYYFDLDDTIADTSKLRVYRRTEDGRKYISENTEKFSIGYYPEITRLVNNLNEKGQASIITNMSEEYAKAVLKRGEFSSSLPVYCDLKKPCQDLFEERVLSKKVWSDGIVIGNSPSDILAAHGYEEDFAGYNWPKSHHLPSVGVLWGKYKDVEERFKQAAKISSAEPRKILLKISQLEEIIEKCEKEGIGYELRKDPHSYNCVENDEFFPYNLEKYAKDIKNIYLGEFYPREKGKHMDDFSQKIIRFKNSRDVPLTDINENLKDEFYSRGYGLLSFDTYIQNLNALLAIAKPKIDGLNLKGKSLVVAAPGSSPEYCNESDINHIFARKINKDFFGFPDTGRFIKRIFPKIKHQRGAEIHIKTMGIKRGEKLPLLDNIIIFDDIYTTGSQTKSIAYLLRKKARFQGNLYCLTLGKTRNT
jgi:phosphoglycolate phosphatase-like HAD superfamily hydrolase